MRKYIMTMAFAAGVFMSGNANTVLFSEGFDTEWRENFPILLDLDGKAQPANVWPFFHDGESGKIMPWWPLKDSPTSNNRYLTSHSIYSPEGKSEDWVCSRAITIPTEGFTLSFDAQSMAFRRGDLRFSDLQVFITNEPVSKTNVPTVPFMDIKDIPMGDAVDACEGDFTHYEKSLDDYVGQTIYISFANLNDDKDMLCIDNVVVQRLDEAEMTVEADDVVLYGNVNVKATITAVKDVTPYEIKIYNDFGYSYSETGDGMKQGEVKVFNLPIEALYDETINYTVEFKAEGMESLLEKRTLTGLTFIPYRKVLVEEATGMSCSNCPMGIYNMESLAENEETKEYSVPVSVHTTIGGADTLVCTEYVGALGITIAPAYRANRELTVRSYSTSLDAHFNPDVQGSFGNFIRSKHNEITTLEVSMNAEYEYEGETAKRVKCEVKVLPALSQATKHLGIGFIMKENNIPCLSSSMFQSNGLSGVASIVGSTFGGWTGLGKMVFDAVFQDVARGIWGYYGLDNSMPNSVTADEEYVFNYTIDIPDTYRENNVNGNISILNPAVDPEMVTMVAYVIDTETRQIVNVCDFPMSAKATERNMDFLKAAVDTVLDNDDANAPVEYFDMQGRRVVNPESGIYVRRQGSKVNKVMF